MLERKDWAVALKVPLGVIPAGTIYKYNIFILFYFFKKLTQTNVYEKGTGNGMIKSLLDSVNQPCTPAHATLAVVRGIYYILYFYFSQAKFFY